MSRKYTFFVHLLATPAWLVAREERTQFAHTYLHPIFARYPSVSVRFYDVEAFTTKCSDIAVFESENIQDYYFAIDAIRDTKFLTVPYFQLVDIFPGIENGFVEYQASLS